MLITGEKMSTPVAIDIDSANLILSLRDSESFGRHSNEFKTAATAMTDLRSGIRV